MRITNEYKRFNRTLLICNDSAFYNNGNRKEVTMSETEKMMQKANVEKDWNPTPYGGIEEYYPPFTAEKQIELIKWLLQNKRLCIRKAEYSNNFYMDTLFNRLDGVDNKDFEQCLASLVNNLWQDLTEEEKQQIKEILK